MNAYIDTSVVLRKLMGEPHPLDEWGQIEHGYASRLLSVEFGRVVDRFRLLGKIGDEEVVQLHREHRQLIRSLHWVGLSEAILSRASGAMPTVLGTLDGIHLATALELTRELGIPLVLATHDAQLAAAARASGLDVIGT